jgi:hypothetical protein
LGLTAAHALVNPYSLILDKDVLLC